MPQREAAHLLMLLRERLHRLDLVAGVSGLDIQADETAQMEPLNFSLFGERQHLREDCLNLVERLQARLGFEAVTGLALCPEHRPELAWREVAPGQATVGADFPVRPLWLLEQPRPLATRAALPWLDGPLRLRAGPERIESGWWDGAGVQRDYYIAQTASGARLWLYRQRGAPARWFLHGIFG
jgi:protein ImuB